MEQLLHETKGFCLKSGDGTAQKAGLFCVHGLGAAAAQWDELADPAELGCDVAMIDLPGHADVEFDPCSMTASFDSFRDHIIDMCDAHALSNLIFAGISMGSALSLMVAAKRPDLVKSVVAVRPAWLTGANPEWLAVIARIGHWFEDGDTAEVLARLDTDPTYLEMLQDVPLSASSLRAAVTRPHGRAHAPVLSAMVADRPFSRLSELNAIQCPVTVIGCHADALHPLSLARQTANALPNARLEILPPRYLEPAAHAEALKQQLAAIVKGISL